MFKKRTRPASVREKTTVDKKEEKEDSAEKGVEGEEDNEETGQSIEELILLRKLRKTKQGIDLEKLNRGDQGRKGKKKEPEIDFSKYGLHSSRKGDDHDDDLEDEKERVKRLVRSNNFTQQTNALDVDKHMLAYIEEEMEKRRGQAAAAAEAGNPEPFDPQAELYKVTERYKEAQAKKELEEGNVTNSMGMLTSIPEFDLGMDNRLKNIEMTEKAKREMMEQRKAAAAEAALRKPEDEDFASARFFRQNRRVASDIYAEEAKRQAGGIPAVAVQKPPRTDRLEAATDEQVYDRFKKRMRK